MKKGASDNMAGQMKGIVPVCVAALTLAASGFAFAREVTVGGGMSVGYEFEDRQYDDEEVASDQEQQQIVEIRKNNNDERYSRLRLSPLVTLTSATERDEFALRYSPSFWQDFETSDNNVDHDFQGSLSRYLTKNWKAALSDTYRLSDIVENRYGDPERRPDTSESTTTTDGITTTDGTATLSDSENRRRYWTNDLSLSSEYEYQHDSMFVLGYRYGILKNTDTDPNRNYEDYDRHELLSEIGHRFDAIWKLSVLGSYVRGLFDNTATTLAPGNEDLVEDDNDVNEYRAATKLQANMIDHHVHSLEYSYYGADYDDQQIADASIHDGTLGWRWDVSKEIMFSLGAGPTYTKTEGADGEWGYNANTTFSYGFERGLVEFTAKRGYEILNFTGTNENGLREFWQSRLKLNYRLQEKLSTDLYASYRYEDEEVITEIAPVSTQPEDETAATDVVTEQETFNRKRFSTGISFGYSFQQWYKLSLAYDYSRQDSELADDSFDEHRVALTLSYETDFFKW